MNDSPSKLSNEPICPYCATTFDPKHYDFVEDRARCSNCAALYQVGDDDLPDLPDAVLDIDDPEGLKALRTEVENAVIRAIIDYLDHIDVAKAGLGPVRRFPAVIEEDHPRRGSRP